MRICRSALISCRSSPASRNNSSSDTYEGRLCIQTDTEPSFLYAACKNAGSFVFVLSFSKKGVDNRTFLGYTPLVRQLVTQLTNQQAKAVILLQVHPSIDKPIFLQIAEQLEDSIFTGVFPEETKIPSTNEVAAVLNINPHTVLKGMNLLVDEDIIYKKRGLGMFVKTGAVEKIRQKRQGQFYEQYIAALIREAEKLQMSKEDIMALIERGYDDERH